MDLALYLGGRFSTISNHYLHGRDHGPHLSPFNESLIVLWLLQSERLLSSVY